jgi:hypothetical protein
MEINLIRQQAVEYKQLRGIDVEEEMKRSIKPIDDG